MAVKSSSKCPSKGELHTIPVYVRHVVLSRSRGTAGFLISHSAFSESLDTTRLRAWPIAETFRVTLVLLDMRLT